MWAAYPLVAVWHTVGPQTTHRTVLWSKLQEDFLSRSEKPQGWAWGSLSAGKGDGEST